jgi:hypothetical protein
VRHRTPWVRERCRTRLRPLTFLPALDPQRRKATMIASSSPDRTVAFGSRWRIGGRGPLFPLGHGLWVDARALGQRPQALLARLYCSTDRRCRGGAAVVNLAPSASLCLQGNRECASWVGRESHSQGGMAVHEHPGSEGRGSTVPPWLASRRSSDESGQKGSQPANPEEVPAGEIGAGENICRGCQGTGRVDSGPCPDCGGTGKVTTPIGGG